MIMKGPVHKADTTPRSLRIYKTPSDVRGTSGQTITEWDTLPRSEMLSIMIKGATKFVLQAEENKHRLLNGILALGGSTSTSVAAEVMRATKIGLPKLIVSTMASGDVSVYVGDSDITIMPSIGQPIL